MNVIDGEQQRKNRTDEERRNVKWCDTVGINSIANKCLGFGSLEAMKS
jgi:hypothetical protein